MRVTREELGRINNHGRRHAYLPHKEGQPAPEGRQKLHRKGGAVVFHVHIRKAELVGPLDEYVDDIEARRAGHASADEYRDAWAREHDAAWTGRMAWRVEFSVEPWREHVERDRGPWDPGVALGGNTPARPRQPEPERVHPAEVEALPSSLEARQRHVRDRAMLEEKYAGQSLTERLARALAESRGKRIDTSSLERLIDRKVTELERRNDRAA